MDTSLETESLTKTSLGLVLWVVVLSRSVKSEREVRSTYFRHSQRSPKGRVREPVNKGVSESVNKQSRFHLLQIFYRFDVNENSVRLLRLVVIQSLRQDSLPLSLPINRLPEPNMEVRERQITLSHQDQIRLLTSIQSILMRGLESIVLGKLCHLYHP